MHRFYDVMAPIFITGNNDITGKVMPGEKSRLPGSEGIWIFVFIDMVVFILIFLVFMGERVRNLELYAASQLHLNELFGLANTLILLASSWMVVEGVQAARAGNERRVAVFLNFAIVLGLLFSLDKLIEYYFKFDEGITLASNQFFTFYFFITFVHFLHVMVGLGFILYFRNRANECVLGRKNEYIKNLENVGLFWHYVDVLWIFIFPVLYLIGRQ